MEAFFTIKSAVLISSLMRFTFETKAVMSVSVGDMRQIAAYFGISLGIVSIWIQDTIIKIKNIPRYFFMLY
jgi:hypothetical protein